MKLNICVLSFALLALLQSNVALAYYMPTLHFVAPSAGSCFQVNSNLSVIIDTNDIGSWINIRRMSLTLEPEMDSETDSIVIYDGELSKYMKTNRSWLSLWTEAQNGVIRVDCKVNNDPKLHVTMAGKNPIRYHLRFKTWSPIPGLMGYGEREVTSDWFYFTPENSET